MIPNNAPTNNSFLRRGRTLGAKELGHEDILDKLKLIDTAMERVMRNQDPIVHPDVVESVEEIPRIIPESIMEHGHGETFDQEEGGNNKDS